MPTSPVVSNVSNGQLIFNWSPATISCSAFLEYEINTTNCGECFDGITRSNFVTCNLPSSLSGICSVTIKTKVNACDSEQNSVSHLQVPLEKSKDIL